MRRRSLMLTTALMLGGLVWVRSQPGCNDFEDINDARREYRQGFNPHDFISDKDFIKFGTYYRFTNGPGHVGRLSDYQSDSEKCNTRHPIYLKELHPRDGVQVAAKVCETHATPESVRLCQATIDVEVTKCPGDFFIYRLYAPIHDESAYCVDFAPIDNSRYPPPTSLPPTQPPPPEEVTSITVGCDNYKFDVTLNTSQFLVEFPRVSIDDLRLGPDGCMPNNAHNGLLTWSVGLNDCSMYSQYTMDRVWYLNTIYDQDLIDNNIIRGIDFAINVTCRLDRNLDAKLSYEGLDEHLRGQTVVGDGEFTIEMSFFKDEDYTIPYVDPVEVYLGTRLYTQVELDTSDKTLKISHLDTVASPDPDFTADSSSPSYMLVEEGCPVDETTQTHFSELNQIRYSFEAFRFLRHHGLVYIHTYIRVCSSTGPQTNACLRICHLSVMTAGNHTHRSARSAPQQSIHRVYNGPVSMAGVKQNAIDPEEASQDSSRPGASEWKWGLVVTGAMIALALVAVAWNLRKRRIIVSGNTNCEQKYSLVQYEEAADRE